MSRHVFDIEKWAALSMFEQMGNIGSEIGRSMNALQRGDEESLDGAYRRGLDLIDATINAWDSEPRKRELLRAREVFTDAIESKTIDRQLDNYFMQYAIAARALR
jgi:hypothetical protein